MFTGIIEDIAIVVNLRSEGSNLHIQCKCNITSEFKIDQSISHNGVCLTVVSIDKDLYSVIAIKETLNKSNLKNLKIGDKINIEREDARQHLSFGFGIHRCLGNRLADLQLKILWEEILERFTHIEITGETKYLNSSFIRGITELPVIAHRK